MVCIVCTGGFSMEIISDEGKMFFGARIFGQKLSFRYFASFECGFHEGIKSSVKGKQTRLMNFSAPHSSSKAASIHYKYYSKSNTRVVFNSSLPLSTAFSIFLQRRGLPICDVSHRNYSDIGTMMQRVA